MPTQNVRTSIATTWTTADSEVLDWIVWKAYGRQNARIVEMVLDANPGLCEQPLLLPEGLVLTLPAMPEQPKKAPKLTRFWE